MSRLSDTPGLPDVIFAYQNRNIGIFWKSLDRTILSLWYIFLVCDLFLWPFGIFYGHFGISFTLWYVVPAKIWQPRYSLLRTVGQLMRE
jgi:hypothetical protein